MADESVVDPWNWDTGLVDDIDFTIEEARFIFNSKIRNGEVLVLSLKGRAVDHETGDAVEDELEQFYACGNGFEPYDSNTRARREDGRKKSFNNRTAIAALCDAAAGAGAKRVLVDRGGPLVSTIWEGLTFHMQQKEEDYGGEIGKRSRLLPVALISEGGNPKAKATKAAAKAATAPAAPAEIAPALLAKLRLAAKEAGSHDEFIDKAFSIEGVDGDEAAMEAVVNPAAIWTEVNG